MKTARPPAGETPKPVSLFFLKFFSSKLFSPKFFFPKLVFHTDLVFNFIFDLVYDLFCDLFAVSEKGKSDNDGNDNSENEKQTRIHDA